MGVGVAAIGLGIAADEASSGELSRRDWEVLAAAARKKASGDHFE